MNIKKEKIYLFSWLLENSNCPLYKTKLKAAREA